MKWNEKKKKKKKILTFKEKFINNKKSSSKILYMYLYIIYIYTQEKKLEETKNKLEGNGKSGKKKILFRGCIKRHLLLLNSTFIIIPRTSLARTGNGKLYFALF